ncbi:MAG: serine hydrolase [Clostridia bacterium]|nr:serine hydrolase [Clostridia bacterium]
MSFNKVSPESVGISSRDVERFINVLNKRKMRMHSVIMCKGEDIFGEFYWAPFNKDLCHRMYSQTKSYVAVAIGFLLDEGKLSLDDKIVDFFPDKIRVENEQIKRQTVRHMLMMSTVGYGMDWFAKENTDRLDVYFNMRGVTRSPGTIWEYDSQGSQVLCALVERLSGKRLFDYLKEKLFDHLGTFKTATILKTPTGESWGDSALLCTSRDMLSFARFVMNYGQWQGKRLLSESYLKEATSKLIDNQEDAHGGPVSYGYGYQIWRTEQNGFAFVGMGDELTICLPDKDLIFVCTADNQGSPVSRSVIMNSFFDIIVDGMEKKPLEENPEAQKSLEGVARELKLLSVQGEGDSPCREKIDGVRYTFPQNELGLKELTFRFENESKGTLHYENANGKMELPFYINENCFDKFPELGYSGDVGGRRTTDGSKYDAAISGAWLSPNKLMLFVQIIDRYLGNVSMNFGFNDEFITVTAYKNAEDFLWNYNGHAYGRRG